jgi:hypothetical protein
MHGCWPGIRRARTTARALLAIMGTAAPFSCFNGGHDCARQSADTGSRSAPPDTIPEHEQSCAAPFIMTPRRRDLQPALARFKVPCRDVGGGARRPARSVHGCCRGRASSRRGVVLAAAGTCRVPTPRRTPGSASAVTRSRACRAAATYFGPPLLWHLRAPQLY